MSEDAPDPDAYVEAVLRIAEQVPSGRVVSYGQVAEAVGRGLDLATVAAPERAKVHAA